MYEDSEDGYASKIPNWSVLKIPKGPLTKNNVHAKASFYSLEYNKEIRYYGQDTLSLGGYQEIDTDKYKEHYIRAMFQASLLRWLDQHKVSPKWLEDKRLNIVTGMPPERYQDRPTQTKAFRAFSSVFNQKRPQHIQMSDQNDIAYHTAFEKNTGLREEAQTWHQVHKLKNGYTLIVDLGYGTSDLCLVHFDDTKPDNKKITFTDTKSLNNGLLHSHYETNPVNPWIAELNTLRRVSKSKSYANITKAKIRSVARQIDLIQLVVFGGGIELLDKDSLADMKTYAPDWWAGDEFTNVRNFMRLAK